MREFDPVQEQPIKYGRPRKDEINMRKRRVLLRVAEFNRLRKVRAKENATCSHCGEPIPEGRQLLICRWLGRKPTLFFCSLNCLKAYRIERVIREAKPEPKPQEVRFSSPHFARRDVDLRGEYRFDATVEGERIDPRAIYDRDHWVCHICGLPVPKDVPAPHNLSAALDHVAPLAGGGHHVSANVACSHRLCNTVKRDRESMSVVEWSALQARIERYLRLYERTN